MSVQVPEAATQLAVFLLSFGVGSFISGYGMYIRLGYSKQYFLKEGMGSLGAAAYHFLPLVGAVFLMLALGALAGDVETRQKLLLYLLTPTILVAFLIGPSQPSWLKPKWLRQLEDNHPDIFGFLSEVAREEVGDDPERCSEWSERMDTLKGQNEWVARVRKYKGWPRRESYRAERPSVKVPRRFRRQIAQVQELPPHQ